MEERPKDKSLKASKESERRGESLSRRELIQRGAGAMGTAAVSASVVTGAGMEKTGFAASSDRAVSTSAFGDRTEQTIRQRERDGLPTSRYMQVIPPKNPQAQESLTIQGSKSVLIVGGGIAGLSAGLELAERGYTVDVREAMPYFGGRLHTRKEELSVGTFSVEHGLHMWFHQYYMFQDILHRLGTWRRYFRPFNEVYFEFETYQPELIVSKGHYPFNLLGIIGNSPNLNLLNGIRTIRALPDIINYRHDGHFERFDNETLFDWKERNRVDQRFFDIIIEPAASVTLNDPKNISVAEVLMMMQIYFIGEPKAFNRWVSVVDHGQAIIDPWVKRLRDLGSTVESSSAVPGIRFEDNRAVGIIGESKSYDHVVLACDVPGAQAVLDGSQATDRLTSQALGGLQKTVRQMRVAPRYHVLRVWFDTPVSEERPAYQAVIETSQYAPINLLCIFEKLEVESKRWAEENSGSIIEFHLYNTPEYEGWDGEAIWQDIRSQAVKVLPELENATTLDYSLGSFENFTSYEVGQGLARPGVDAAKGWDIANLTLAGDWVDMEEFPTALMERSIATGRIAANSILLDDDVRQVELIGGPSRGPGLSVRF